MTHEERQVIQDNIRDIILHHGPELTAEDCLATYACALINAERERCAEMVEEYTSIKAYDPEEYDLKELAYSLRVDSVKPAGTPPRDPPAVQG